MTSPEQPPSVAIIGAGPAGLTAAYLLAKRGVPVTVLEADPEYVGGISRTARYKGFHFDIGGRRDVQLQQPDERPQVQQTGRRPGPPPTKAVVPTLMSTR
jgi:phytoene dehydrogenase-like protein